MPRRRCHHFAPLPTDPPVALSLSPSLSERVRHCVAKTAFQTLCPSVSKSGTAGQRRTTERMAAATRDGRTDGRRSIFNLDLPLPPPSSDDTREPRPRSFSRRVPMSRALRVGLAVSPPRRLQETARSARSQSHYCAMGTYHFALPTRRLLALRFGANQ